jgi:hypothetical protein
LGPQAAEFLTPEELNSISNFVSNQPPVISVNNSTVTIGEGSVANNTGTHGDVGTDTVALSSSVGSVVDNLDGTWSWSFNTSDGPDESQSVTITATDSDGAMTQTSFVLTVNNVAPTVAISGPTEVVSEEKSNWTLTANDSSQSDQNAGFSYHIDWDGDGIVDQSQQGLSGTSVDYTFTQAGTFSVNVTAVDKDGGISLAYTLEINVIQSVEIDIKPGGDDVSSTNLKNNGVIAVAIITTNDFDAATVDASTVIFAGANALKFSMEDVDGDGDLDMILHFSVQDTNLRETYEQLLLDDMDADGVLDSNKQIATVSLSGTTTDDTQIFGDDDVNLFLSGKALREIMDELFGF